MKLNVRFGYLEAAVAAFALFGGIGHFVDHQPDPSWLMGAEMSWVGHATPFAILLTWCGYVVVLAPLCLVLIVAAVIWPRWRLPIAFSIVALLLAWQGADFFQHFFARPRRLDWIVKHETAFSYPSSHAAIATAFYLYWSVQLARSELRYRAAAAAALALLALGIVWSRLALGAHYLTDIAGGVLWGITVVAALGALLPINIFQGRTRASLE